MPGAKHLPAYTRVQQPSWYYLGGQTLVTPNDQAVALPSEADSVVISMETGAGYYSINGGASANSPGYIPQDGFRSVGPIANLTSINVHSPTGTVHAMFWREQA